MLYRGLMVYVQTLAASLWSHTKEQEESHSLLINVYWWGWWPQRTQSGVNSQGTRFVFQNIVGRSVGKKKPSQIRT